MEKEKLEQLLENISNEGRAEAIYQMCNKSHDISHLSQGYLQEALRHFEEHQEYHKVGRIAERIGLDYLAAINYQKSGLSWVPIANKAIKRFEEKRQFVHAGRFAEEVGLFGEAALNYEKAGMFEEAAEAAKNGKLEQKEAIYQTLVKLTST